jgi:hypothetical protein
MRISLLQISLLRFFKKFHNLAILFHWCEFLGYLNLPYANFGLFYFIRAIFWASLANANFLQNQKSH